MSLKDDMRAVRNCAHPATVEFREAVDNLTEFFNNFPDPPPGYTFTGDVRFIVYGEYHYTNGKACKWVESDQSTREYLILRKDTPECPFKPGDLVMYCDVLRHVRAVDGNSLWLSTICGIECIYEKSDECRAATTKEVKSYVSDQGPSLMGALQKLGLLLYGDKS